MSGTELCRAAGACPCCHTEKELVFMASGAHAYPCSGCRKAGWLLVLVDGRYGYFQRGAEW